MAHDPVSLTSAIAGDGPPLVIIHGLFGQAKNWGALSKTFAEDFTVHALDLRNHGHSPRANTMTYEAMVADVIRYLDTQGIDQTAILGHSMGGKVAMLVALQHPEMVSQLIVADIAPVDYDHDFTRHFEAIRAIELGALKSRQDADRIMADYIDDAMVRAFLLSNLSRDGDRQWYWQINHEAIWQHMHDIIGWPSTSPNGFDAPTLFLRGAESNYLTDAMTSAITRLFPRAEFDSITKAGHWLHADQPQAFVTRCLDFLR
ncbi:MAG: alpha/beta fold hydrolase [Pseudomonadota bacterium]